MDAGTMRHAWLILADGELSILKKLICFLDSERADLFVLMDESSTGADEDALRALPRRSRLTLLPRRKTQGGAPARICCELMLLRAAVPGGYDYYHLLSGSDVPVKSRTYIEDYFARSPGTNYLHFYAPVLSPDHRRAALAQAPQRLPGVDRAKKTPALTFQRGAAWFSITHALADYALSREAEIREVFRSARHGEEMFLQTLAVSSPFRSTLPPRAFEDDPRSCCRYFDMSRRGQPGRPYTFAASDQEELMSTPPECLFAVGLSCRETPALVDRLFDRFGAGLPVPPGVPKKVCILGPIPPKTMVGGVAIFDMGLAEGFRRLGADVFLCTQQEEECPLRHYRVNHFNIRSVMEREQPELIIASLQYGSYFRQLHKWGPRVLILHGYFNFQNYGVPKTLAAVALQKSMARHADAVLSNSNLTRTMNDLFWALPSDGVIPLGTTADYLRQVESAGPIRNAANRQVLYVGRWVKSKQADKLVLAARELHRRGVSFPLHLAGGGEEEAALRTLAGDDGEIVFRGFVPHGEIYPLFRSSEIFVSLSETEPFGITFAEALLAGCKIVCPATGGQTEFLRRYPDRVRFISSTAPGAIARAIEELLGTPVEELQPEKVCPEFDYAATAKAILDHFKPVKDPES